ncbi:MAG: hypothetical protein KJ000_02500 [Pirellulaceae bacterium]|nr:hypothetical protein [Pirellulaceae bacterium]
MTQSSNAARTVFAYASTEQQRRHGPRGYTSYRAYKPWLRDEFAFRCVYCLLRISWWLTMVQSRH